MRRAAVLLTVAVVIGFVTVASGVATADDDGVGRIHRIDIKAQHPKAYHPAVGDLVQCYIDFPIVPEQIISDLRPAIDGKSMSLVAVVSTSSPKIVGSGQVSVFLIPRDPGLSHVKIEVIIPGQETKTYDITFLVAPPRER
jgi:hypothetical protein